MKGILQGLIFPIVVFIVGSSLFYFLTKDKVGLEYYLTEPIPLVIKSGEVIESVQQLTVLNSGDVAIDSIGIKVKGKIKEAELVKNFVDDKVAQSTKGTYLQAKYSNLPPHSKFSYIIKSTVNGISSADIEISYPKGKAVNALEPNNSESIFLLTYIVFILALLIYFVFSSFKSLKINKLNLNDYKSILSTLNVAKPYYIDQKSWGEARTKYIERQKVINSFYCNNLEETESYKILDSNKPEYISDFEWNLLENTMLEKFEKLFLYSVKESYDNESLHKIIAIRKPKSFIQSKWQELTNTAFKGLSSINSLSGLYKDRSPTSVADIIKKDIPTENIDPSLLEKYKKALKDKYFSYFLIDLLQKIRFSSYSLGDFDDSLLDANEKKIVQDIVYKLNFLEVPPIKSVYDAELFLGEGEAMLSTIQTNKYKLLNEDDHKEFESIAKAYIQLDRDIASYNKLHSCIRTILQGSTLDKKPEEIGDDEWGKLKNIEVKLVQAAKQNKVDRDKLSADSLEVSQIKAKVIKQLSIISNVLSDSKKAFEIEDYDNPFAEGNFKNLKKVAEILESRS